MVPEEHSGRHEGGSTPSILQEVNGTMDERLRQLLIANFVSTLPAPTEAVSAFSTPHLSLGFGNPHGGFPTITSSWPGEATGYFRVLDRLGNRE